MLLKHHSTSPQSISRLTYRPNPSLSALHRSPWPQARQKAGQSRQRSSQSFVRSSVSSTDYPPLHTLLYSTALRHLYHCIHNRSSLPLPHAARRTPITSPPPLSLQITHHLPSHIFETSAVVISQVRYCPVATCPVEHQPLHPEQRRRRPGLGRLHEHCRCPVRGMASNC
jgi:hypothetical protein